MAYKYFSQQLLTKNLVDLSEVFPQKQQIAKEQNNVAYNLGDIVLYLQEVTENFKFTDAKYIDLDQAVKAIVNKYYVSIAAKNPFDSDIDTAALSQFKEGVVPREAAIVKEGEIKGKGVAKPAPSRVKEVVELVEEAPKKSTPKKDKVTPAPTEAAIEKADDVKIQQFKNTLDNLQMLFDDSTLDEQQDIITSQTKRADGLEFFIEDSEGEDVSFQKEQLALLRQFIANNSK
jgi:hypothetical protein